MKQTLRETLALWEHLTMNGGSTHSGTSRFHISPSRKQIAMVPLLLQQQTLAATRHRRYEDPFDTFIGKTMRK